ncbi:50S ribosomal protein L3 [Candidatus Microgenomates bacterium]|nr:50S ribosomal protein L3 [Candidatus Microgenomates bacterium]
MKGFILGAKQDQSQTFSQNGERIPVTRISTAPCYVVGIHETATRGYNAVKLGFGTGHNMGKPAKGELKKAGITAPLRFLREFRVSADAITEENGKKALVIGETKVFIGEEVKPSIVFKAGDKIDVTGTSKGKGFQGVVRRHGFSGGPKTHGQSDRWRAPGSIGAGTTPGRILKGKRMAGRMGGDRITVKGLEVVEVKDTEMTVKGLVPGYRTGLLRIVAE